jgi:flagellar capping protein FliD
MATSATGTTFTGLSTGIDWESVIQQLMTVEHQPVTLLENRVATLEFQLSRWSNIQGQLQSLLGTVQSLDTVNEFAAKSASSSDETIVGVSAGASANPGSYEVVVQQLARSHKIACQGWADASTTPVGDNGGDLVIQVGSETITINAADIDGTTTLSELADLINRNSGNDNLVTATVLNDGSGANAYRLVLTSVETGEANAISMTSNPTNLDFSHTAVDDPEESSSWAGTSHPAIGSGANYTGTANKTFSFAVQGTTGTHYMVGASDLTVHWTDSTGASGNFVIPSGYSGGEIAVAEGVTLTFNVGSGEDLVGGDTFDIDVFNPTLQAASDALIRVDGIYMSKSSNTITDVIEGLTLELLSADPSTTVTITASNDTAAVESQVTDFVNAYNSLMATFQAATSYDSENEIASPLLGDSTASSIRGTLEQIIASLIPGLSSGASLSSLADVGITTSQGGMLEVDSEALEEALTENFEAVVNLFTENSSSSSSSVFYQSRDTMTQAGTYAVGITYDASGTITSASINGHAATIDGIFIVGADGTAEEGLRLGFTAPGGGAGTVSAQVRLGLGAFASLGDQLTGITDPEQGQVYFATDSLSTRIENLNSQIQSMEDRLTEREDMYRRQFTNLEVALSQMQTQSQYLTQLLG